ncbi:GNAT family N-acetyltransferase [Enterococcus mediterraneensis]|uniref:GNAT family N-acetyltransferase n=1 Tax=Enterococcus mediterraneensis TaxID=2364791 RepID=UPI003B968091
MICLELYTERLILRPWKITDAEDLYGFASDPQIGPVAGWPPHTSVENSREIIETVLMDELTFAIALKDAPDKAIGSIGIMTNEQGQRHSFMGFHDAEIGYWLAADYWGQGIVPEAVAEILRYGFEDLDIPVMWCGYYEGNEKSKRVQEKAGFVYERKEKVDVPLLQEQRIEHFTRLTRETWEQDKK